jgi:cytochrome oxidase assembly protein ShyY1
VTGGLRDWFSRPLLGLHLLAIVAVAVCVVMGLWQLGVYGAKHEDEAAARANATPVDLLKVWGPDDAFTADLVDRRVRIHGHFPLDQLFTVKRPDGQVWLATTVPVDGTKSAIVVVLGHAPNRLANWVAPPSTFTGILQPSEPGGELSMAQRVNTSKWDLFSGYVLLDGPTYAHQAKPVKPPTPDVSWTVGLRNLAYALQWWVFGLFAGFMWWRMATDALEVRRAPTDRPD